MAIGKVKSLLHHPNLGGFVSNVIVTVGTEDQSTRVVWVATSRVQPAQSLSQNSLLIVEQFIDPLATALGLPRPTFRVSIEKTPPYVFSERDQIVQDTSAGAAMLLAMVSTLIGIPINEAIAVTGAVSPPSLRVSPVEGYEDKFNAALTDENISTVLVPGRRALINGASEVTPDSIQYAEWFDIACDKTQKVQPFSSIDDLWPQAFPPDKIFNVFFKHKSLYKSLIDLNKSGESISGLLGYLRSVFEERWQILSRIAAAGNLGQTEAASDTLMEFYRTNSLPAADIYPNLKKVLSSQAHLRNRPVFTHQHWYDISKLFGPELEDDLLGLLLLARDTSAATQDPSAPNSSFVFRNLRARIGGLLLLSASEKDFGFFMKILNVSIRKFTADVVVPEFREDIHLLLKRQYFDDWVETYDHCCSAFDNVVSLESISFLDRQAHEELQKRTFAPFVRRVNDGLKILRSLMAVDPVLVSRLRSHESLSLISRVFEEANEILSPDLITLATLGEKIKAQFNRRLFGELHGNLCRFDDQILNHVKVRDSAACLTPDPADIAIRVVDDLSRLDYRIAKHVRQDEASARGVIKNTNNRVFNPVMLWQGSEDPPNLWRSDQRSPDFNEILQLPDGNRIVPDREGKFHKAPGIIPELLQYSVVDVKYSGVSVACSVPFGVPARMNTLFIMRTLGQRGYFIRDLKSVADIGSGNGFLGICLTKNNPFVNSLFFVDMNASSKLFSEFNTRKNLQDRLIRDLVAVSVTGFGLEAIAHFGPFDLVLCGTQCLPGIEEYALLSGLDISTNGIDLLESVVLDGRRAAKELVVELSEIALPEFRSAVVSAGAIAQHLGSNLMPFSILTYGPENPESESGSVNMGEHLIAHNQLRDYVDTLVKERGLRTLNQHNYKYWHKIHVYSVTYPDI